MASKQDWNDVSDDDSDEGNQHHEQEHFEELKDQPQELPCLNKIVSSPFPEKKSANEQDNLKKLQNCKRDKIWLYVPLYYKDNVEEIDSSLRSEENIKKIQKFSKGWNLLVNREQAKVYITEGKKQGRFFIKFYFSSKNEQNQPKFSSYKNLDNMERNGDYDNRKVKYVLKSPTDKEELRDAKSPEVFRKVQSQNDNNVSRTLKSPTFKNNQSRKYQEDFRPKNYSKSSLRREDSRGNDIPNVDSRGYKQKYVNKNSLPQNVQKPNQQFISESPKKKYVAKVEEPIKAETISLANKVSKDKKAYEPQHKDEESGQQSNDNTAQKKARKKKNKKNELLRDNNNPFSLLNGI